MKVFPTFTSVVALSLILFAIIRYIECGDVCRESVCHYEFVVRESRSMMHAVEYPNGWQDVYDVALNGSKLYLEPNGFHKQVPNIQHKKLAETTNTLDGIPAFIAVINDRLIGPTIEVMEGAQIVVRVVNNLRKETLTIHWHGMHQRSTVYSDGVPFVTQCPILPKQTFTYRFFGKPAGTHWYHSHVSNQKMDGLFGALIIHRKKPVLPYHVAVISDWYHRTATELETSNPYKTFDRGSGRFHYQTFYRYHSFDGVKCSSVQYTSGLINGRGRYKNNKAPLSVFKVESGTKFKLHLVGAMGEYAYRFSIDNHTMSVVETDGYPIQPIHVHSIIIFGGETYVVEVDANNFVANYWIKAETLKDGIGPFVRPDENPKETILAVLHYHNAPIDEDPGEESVSVRCTKKEPCKVLNCPWREFPSTRYPYTECVHIEDLRMDSSLTDEVDQTVLTVDDEDVYEIFLNFAFSIGSSINNHRFLFPSSAPIYDTNATKPTKCTSQCFDRGCRCTNLLKLPKKKVIQMVLMGYTTINDFGKNYSNKAHHQVHLHGHSFFVLKQGYGETSDKSKRITATNKDIVCENRVCSRHHWRQNSSRQQLNLENPPLKDTVVVPSQGYTVIRFRSDNPGYWLLHCHAMFHNEEGMTLVVDEATEDLRPPPPGFPKCNSFDMTDDEFSQWHSNMGLTK